MVSVVLVTAILLAMFMVGIVLAVRYQSDSAPNVIGIFMIIIGALGMFMWVLTSALIYFNSFNTARELEAFYHDTRSAYEYTISATEDVVIDPSRTRGDAITDLAYQEQGQAVSERIREFRNRILWYNEELRKLQGRNGWFILGAFYEDAPEDLKPIRIGVSP